MSLVDVARAAGVSTATVSRVLNDLPVVSHETAAAVRAAAAELNYSITAPRRRRRGPSTPRSSRSARDTKTVGVITIGHDRRKWLGLPVMAAAMGGIHRAAADLGWGVMLEELFEGTEQSKLLSRDHVDGALVFLSSSLDPDIATRAIDRIRAKIPVVRVMGGDTHPAHIDRVSPDNIGVGRVAFDYLKSLGCKRLAFLTTRADWAFMRLRCQSFASAAWENHLAVTSFLVRPDPALAKLFGTDTVAADTVEELVERLVASPTRPDGLFLGNDYVASRVHPLLTRLGVRIGRDIHLVSCDNEPVRLDELKPRPASIDIRADELGAAALVRLATLIDQPDQRPQIVTLPPQLVLPSH